MGLPTIYDAIADPISDGIVYSKADALRSAWGGVVDLWWFGIGLLVEEPL